MGRSISRLIAPCSCALWLVAVLSGPVVHARANAQAPDSVAISATVKTIRPQFCEDNLDWSPVALALSIEYRNRGRTPVTIFTGLDLPVETIVARTIADLRAHKFLADFWGDTLTDEEGHRFGNFTIHEREVNLLRGRTTRDQMPGFGDVRRPHSDEVRPEPSSMPLLGPGR